MHVDFWLGVSVHPVYDFQYGDFNINVDHSQSILLTGLGGLQTLEITVTNPSK